MMVLDQCIPSTAPHDQAAAAMELTHRWARRSLAARGDSPQALFGIVQGACHRDLREKSAAFLRGLPFDGMAIGGLAVGETHAERYEFTGLVAGLLPENLPRYLMGVGTPIDILEAVHRGVDMFDCIIPGQLAQRAWPSPKRGRMMLPSRHPQVFGSAAGSGVRLRHVPAYTRAYLHHLVKADEMLGWHLLGIHNFAFYHRLMREMRASIFARRLCRVLRAASLRTRAQRRGKCRAPGEETKTGAGDPSWRLRHRHRPQGFSSIRQISSGEVMHSVNRPSEEARKLYVDQPGLAGRLMASTSRQTNSSFGMWVWVRRRTRWPCWNVSNKACGSKTPKSCGLCAL